MENKNVIAEANTIYFKLKKRHFSDLEISKVARIIEALAS